MICDACVGTGNDQDEKFITGEHVTCSTCKGRGWFVDEDDNDENEVNGDARIRAFHVGNDETMLLPTGELSMRWGVDGRDVRHGHRGRRTTG